jgi:hypothetical protein
MMKLLLWTLLTLLPSLIVAQTEKTRLVGRVLGSDGSEPIAGAAVILNNINVPTDKRGMFTIDPARIGTHLVRFEMIGISRAPTRW